MKKFLLLTKLFIIAIASGTLLFSCQKTGNEKVQKRAFKANASTWYRVAPLPEENLSTITIGQNNYTTFTYVPGGGQGNATHMGNVRTYFNQLAYTSNINVPIPAPAGSLVAPVVDVINYPVIGFPLPLIQAGDFAGLVTITNTLNIPQQSNGKIVSSFFYNDKGDAVFISNSTASVIMNISPNRNEFSGKALIVGGRGKFANATGEVDFKGSFNPNNPNEADYGVDGWISY